MRGLGAVSVLLLSPSAIAIRKNSRRHVSNNGCVNLMVVGDFGNAGSAQRSVARSMAAEASNLNAVAILGLGDNIYDDGAESIKHMAKAWQDIWLAHDGNRRPWYAVLGNHDWREEEDTGAMKDFTTSSTNEGFWNVPDYWYTQRFEAPFGAIEVFAIDSQSWRGSVDSLNGGKQEGWLDDKLSRSNATWKIVMGHHPVYSAGSHGGSGTMQDELDPIMRDHQVPIYFAGHDHSQQHIKWRNLHYIVAGSGSKSPRDREDDYPKGSLMEYQGEPGFVSLSICEASKATLKFYKASGSVKYETSLANWGNPADWPVPPGDENPVPAPFPNPDPAPFPVPDPDPFPGFPVPAPPSDGGGRRRRRKDDKGDKGKKKSKSGKKSVEEEEEEARKETWRSKHAGTCGGVVLKKVDLRCARDGCTVIPDVPFGKVSCEEYCSSQNLKCAGAWKNTFEDCRMDEEIGCGDLLTCGSAQVCQCA